MWVLMNSGVIINVNTPENCELNFNGHKCQKCQFIQIDPTSSLESLETWIWIEFGLSAFQWVFSTFATAQPIRRLRLQPARPSLPPWWRRFWPMLHRSLWRGQWGIPRTWSFWWKNICSDWNIISGWWWLEHELTIFPNQIGDDDPIWLRLNHQLVFFFSGDPFLRLGYQWLHPTGLCFLVSQCPAGERNAGVLSQRDERNAAGSRRIKAKVGDLEYRVFHRFFWMTKCPTPVTKCNLLENSGSNSIYRWLCG